MTSQAATLPHLGGNFETLVGRMVGTKQPPDSPKSVLRYPGGKTRAVQTIREFIPKETDQIVAPFLGGASVELACAADGTKVYGSDAFAPVVNFWRHALREPVLLSERVRVHHPLTRTKFYSLQKGYQKLPNDLEKAAVFYVLNRSSFSGTTLSGGMSPGHKRFTPSAIDRLRDFRASNLEVDCLDWQEALNNHSETLAYLDPPYANGEKLYGDRGDMHDGFDHEVLAKTLNGRDNWILSYNDCDTVRSLYSSHRIIEPKWIYGMSNDKRSKELLIVNV